MRLVGIPTAEPLAFATLAGPFAPLGSVYVSREICGTSPFIETIKRSDADRKALLTQYAQLMAKLHRYGFYPNDILAENLVVRPDEQGMPQCYVIDHESTRPFVGWLRRWREVTLSQGLNAHPQLSLSNREKERFVANYLTALSGHPPNARAVGQLFRRITERAIRRRPMIRPGVSHP